MINNKQLDGEIREILTETIPNLCEFFYYNIHMDNAKELMEAEEKLMILSKTIKNMLSALCGKVRFHEKETIEKEIREFEENEKEKR